MPTTIFATNYRGFPSIEIDVSATTFLVGDNSSGKSSILHLVNYVMGSRLYGIPTLDDSMGIGPYDFFSPYFNYAPVTIGFSSTNKDGETTSRLVELHRDKKGAPDVKRALFCHEGLCVVLKKSGQYFFCKIRNNNKKYSIDDIKEIFGDDKGFTRFEVVDFPDQSVNFPVTAYMAIMQIDPEIGKNHNINRALFASDYQTSRHCAPLRAQPERYYSFERKYKASGTHFASMWHDLKADHSSDLNKSIQKFGKASGLFDDIDVTPISKKIQESPLTVIVKRNGKDFSLNQVGVGVSQVVPILVECIFGSFEKNKPIMLLQQPELHLHPVAQAAVGDFLFEMRLGGLVSIVETHSDFLIDRYRARIRENSGEHEASIVYCYSDKIGNHASSIDIARDGTLVDPPENYNQFFVNEILRTMF
ncbi:AAA family ATPase [Shinella sp. H4-D48]|uniref:AAA family ATPase n=1 Tax=Shinella sp. H4-D48 TaxID=2925841 RepID=UPI001F536A24|nr:AAA family ATPase [Shinella sp. H4-D48]UNK39664.1 AAA family ATPase [Shinella sp. H4-D48]